MPKTNRIGKNMRAINKCVPDPKQFLIGLFAERFPGMNSCVHAQERVRHVVILQLLVKGQMFRRDEGQGFLGLRSACRDAVAFQCRVAAIDQKHFAVLPVETEIGQ